MEKLKSCISYIIAGLMSLIVFIGLFFSTKGYNTNEVININPSAAQNQAKKVYHSIGNGFSGISFTNGAGMVIQSICQILLIIGCFALIALAILQTLKTFNVVKENTIFNNKVAKKILEYGSLVLLFLSFMVFIEYLTCAKTLHYAIGLGSIFNFLVILLSIFGRKILESKLSIKL